MDLSRRSDAVEEMDGPGVDAATYARCLHDLAMINRVTLTHRPTLRWLARATRDLPPDVPLTVLDVACGEGDLMDEGQAVQSGHGDSPAPVAQAGRCGRENRRSIRKL